MVQDVDDEAVVEEEGEGEDLFGDVALETQMLEAKIKEEPCDNDDYDRPGI